MFQPWISIIGGELPAIIPRNKASKALQTRSSELDLRKIHGANTRVVEDVNGCRASTLQEEQIEAKNVSSIYLTEPDGQD